MTYAEHVKPKGRPNVCVGIATRGRSAQVRLVVERLRRQSLGPSVILVACVEPADAEGVSPGADLRIVFGPAGLTRQRNAILQQMPGNTDYVVFFDDDFLPDDDWLEVVAKEFVADPALVCVTGNVVADGILGPGLSPQEAENALQSRRRRDLDWRIAGYSPYGCNMAFRASAIEGMWFDERLVLYGWLEDRDFGSRAGRRGMMAKIGGAVGAHLGVKRGRVSGKRLGYSQVVNPLYLRAKGTMRLSEATNQIARNLLANAAKSLWPEPYVDRRGRVVGNALAIWDVLRGHCEPERAERL